MHKMMQNAWSRDVIFNVHIGKPVKTGENRLRDYAHI